MSIGRRRSLSVDPESIDVDALMLARWLLTLRGPQFLSFTARYPMDAPGKMLKAGRVDRQPNPWLGRGLIKQAVTQATVCFDYERKRKGRGGAEPRTHTSWHVPVLLDGRPSPMAVHKGDTAIVGDRQVLRASARLYLRYEVVRDGGDGPRQSRDKRSGEQFLLPDGSTVKAGDLTQYLPQPKRTDETDFQVTAFEHLVEVRAAGNVWRRDALARRRGAA